MKIALIRSEVITHLDGVNRFIAILAEGFRALGHDVIVVSWSYRNVGSADLARWFRDTHGLDYELEVHALRGPEEHDKWAIMMLEWFTKGSRLLKRLDVDIAMVNGVVPLGFKPKIAVAHGPLAGVSKAQRAVLKLLYKMYDYVICVST